VVGGGELPVPLAVPLVEVGEELQPQAERLAGEAGLRILGAILEEEGRQRCQIHKRRNGKEHLPEHSRADYDRQLRNAYAMASYEDAWVALEKLSRT